MSATTSVTKDLAVRQNQIIVGIDAKSTFIAQLLNSETKKDKFLGGLKIVANSALLQKCSPDSIVNACVGIALSQLDPDPQKGQCYLIPYADECTLQIGYRGWITIIDNYGLRIKDTPIFKCDTFEMLSDGFEEKTLIKQNFKERKLGNNDWVNKNLVGVFIAAQRKSDGERWSNFVSVDEINKVRDFSWEKIKEDWKKRRSPWGAWYLEMACKTAIKKTVKKLPLNGDVLTLVRADDKAEGGEIVNFEKTVNNYGVIDSAPIDSTATTVNEICKSAEYLELKQAIESAKIPEHFNDICKAIKQYAQDIGVDYKVNADIKNLCILLMLCAKEFDIQFETSRGFYNEFDIGSYDENAPIDDVIDDEPLMIYSKGCDVLAMIQNSPDNNTLVAFWETVPDDLKTKYQKAFYLKQDTFR